ncbi:MAG: ABC transporter permease [Acidimicrobiia bacterium]|nr:ABC transporter permease [Acidimicrobiia bacterium]
MIELWNRFNALPAWARWPVLASLGILLLAVVQGVSGTQLLTDEGTANAMVRWSIPILLAGLGGLFSERAGVVNIGLEGMMVLGTWFGAWGALNWGPWGGLLAGLVGGALGGLLHAIATVTFRVDHIVSGVAINILAPGLARYLSERIFTGEVGGSVSQSPRVDGFDKFTIPVISDILQSIRDLNWFWISDIAGVLRGFVANLSLFTLLGLLLVPVSSFILWKTRFGLRLRICGENPWAGESLGVAIYRHKYMGVIISGALSGLAGAFIVLELSGLYRGGQTTGRGFIGLAALIFGNWRASGVLIGSLLFSYPFGLSLVDFDAETSGEATRALLLVMAIGLAAVALWALRSDRKVDLLVAGGMAAVALVWYLGTQTAASWLPNTMPYVLVLVVLVFASQKLRMPKADGQPFTKGAH